MAFVVPDFNSPLDTQRRLAEIPEDEMLKGIFFNTAINETLRQTGKTLGRGNYNMLSSYPVSELIQLLDEASNLVYPGYSQRQSLRMLGQLVIPKLKTVPAGSFIFSTIGNDIGKGFSLVKRFYNMLSQTRADVIELSDHHAVFSLKDVWTFPYCYHVGIVEGFVKSFNKTGMITIQEHNINNIDIRCEWH